MRFTRPIKLSIVAILRSLAIEDLRRLVEKQEECMMGFGFTRENDLDPRGECNSARIRILNPNEESKGG